MPSGHLTKKIMLVIDTVVIMIQEYHEHNDNV